MIMMMMMMMMMVVVVVAEVVTMMLMKKIVSLIELDSMIALSNQALHIEIQDLFKLSGNYNK